MQQSTIGVVHTPFVWCSLLLVASTAFGGPRQGATPLPPKPKAAATATLLLEAGLVTKAGTARPVLRTTFYILRESATDLLAPFMTVPGKEPDFALEAMCASNLWGGRWAGYGSVNVPAALGRLSQRSVQTVKTDFTGKIAVTGLRPGKYWVFGTYNYTENGCLAWNEPINVRAPQTKLILDLDNAAAHY